MRKRIRRLTHAAIIAALYVVLTNFQNLILPGSATWAIRAWPRSASVHTTAVSIPLWRARHPTFPTRNRSGTTATGW